MNSSGKLSANTNNLAKDYIHTILNCCLNNVVRTQTNNNNPLEPRRNYDITNQNKDVNICGNIGMNFNEDPNTANLIPRTLTKGNVNNADSQIIILENKEHNIPSTINDLYEPADIERLSLRENNVLNKNNNFTELFGQCSNTENNIHPEFVNSHSEIQDLNPETKLVINKITSHSELQNQELNKDCKIQEEQGENTALNAEHLKPLFEIIGGKDYKGNFQNEANSASQIIQESKKSSHIQATNPEDNIVEDEIVAHFVIKKSEIDDAINNDQSINFDKDKVETFQQLSSDYDNDYVDAVYFLARGKVKKKDVDYTSSEKEKRLNKTENLGEAHGPNNLRLNSSLVDYNENQDKNVNCNDDFDDSELIDLQHEFEKIDSMDFHENCNSLELPKRHIVENEEVVGSRKEFTKTAEIVDNLVLIDHVYETEQNGFDCEVGNPKKYLNGSDGIQQMDKLIGVKGFGDGTDQEYSMDVSTHIENGNQPKDHGNNDTTDENKTPNETSSTHIIEVIRVPCRNVEPCVLSQERIEGQNNVILKTEKQKNQLNMITESGDLNHDQVREDGEISEQILEEVDSVENICQDLTNTHKMKTESHALMSMKGSKQIATEPELFIMSEYLHNLQRAKQIEIEGSDKLKSDLQNCAISKDVKCFRTGESMENNQNLKNGHDTYDSYISKNNHLQDLQHSNQFISIQNSDSSNSDHIQNIQRSNAEPIALKSNSIQDLPSYFEATTGSFETNNGQDFPPCFEATIENTTVYSETKNGQDVPSCFEATTENTIDFSETNKDHDLRCCKVTVENITDCSETNNSKDVPRCFEATIENTTDCYEANNGQNLPNYFEAAIENTTGYSESNDVQDLPSCFEARTEITTDISETSYIRDLNLLNEINQNGNSGSDKTIIMTAFVNSNNFVNTDDSIRSLSSKDDEHLRSSYAKKKLNLTLNLKTPHYTIDHVKEEKAHPLQQDYLKIHSHATETKYDDSLENSATHEILSYETSDKLVKKYDFNDNNIQPINHADEFSFNECVEEIADFTIKPEEIKIITEHFERHALNILSPECYGEFDFEATGELNDMGVDHGRLSESRENESYETDSETAKGQPEREMELLSPDDTIPRIRRCSSLKTGKTPPGTPSRKKIVRFADVLGLDLADVRTFLDDIPKIPSSAYNDLKDDLDFPIYNPSMKNQRVLLGMFRQPGGQTNFLEKVTINQVMLENAVIEDPISFSIRGLVRVRNLDFDKQVHVRYSVDSWKTFSDLQAVYVDNSSDGFTDKFTFLLYAYSLSIGQKIEFAVRFQSKTAQYWDNNSGANYSFQCLPASNPASTANYAPISSGVDDQIATFYYMEATTAQIRKLQEEKLTNSAVHQYINKCLQKNNLQSHQITKGEFYTILVVLFFSIIFLYIKMH